MRASREALHQATIYAAASSLRSECTNRSNIVVEIKHEEVYRWVLGDEPPTGVEPTQVTPRPGSRAVRSKPRVYPPQKDKGLADRMARVEAAEVVFSNK